MNQALKHILAYGIAILIPVLLYAYFFLNEKSPVLSVLVPTITFAAAGYITADIGTTGTRSTSWIIWSAVIGAILGFVAILAA